jgi:hypothetical protein
VLGALFLESSRISPNLSVPHERLLYVDHVRYVWRVGQVFPCRVYVDSFHRDSQI